LGFLADREKYLEMRTKGLSFAESKSWSAVNNSLISRYIELTGASLSIQPGFER
ncbi:MAG: hypothetical protein HGA26_05305, partial [Chlorobiaceae bacterium]|nr:hypothetical protein [Chlorobiaceae bacterium]